jgi:hypothetical protein
MEGINVSSPSIRMPTFQQSREVFLFREHMKTLQRKQI